MNHGNWREAHNEFINIIKTAKSQYTANDSERPDPCVQPSGNVPMPSVL